jgi:hypothetical protein
MAGTLHARKNISEPPSIAVVSPLGWAAVTPGLLSQNRRAAREPDADSDTARRPALPLGAVAACLRAAARVLAGVAGAVSMPTSRKPLTPAP